MNDPGCADHAAGTAPERLRATQHVEQQERRLAALHERTETLRRDDLSARDARRRRAVHRAGMQLPGWCDAEVLSLDLHLLVEPRTAARLRR